MSLPTDFRWIRVQNLQQHKGVVVEDSKGIPRFSMGPLQYETKDLKDVQLNTGWIDEALKFLRQNLIKVFLDDVELTDTALAELKYIDTAGSVTGYLKRSPNDFTTFPSKSNLAADDVFLIEDSGDGFSKKQVKFSDIGQQPLRVDFDHTDVVGGSLSLGTVISGHLVRLTVVEVLSPFDGSTDITVGDNVAQGRFQDERDNNPRKIDVYQAFNHYEYAGDTEIKLFFPAGAPTTGSGRAIVYVD